MLTSPALSEYIDRQKERGVANIKSFEIEKHKRYAMTAAAFILTVIGMSLSSRKVKGYGCEYRHRTGVEFQLYPVYDGDVNICGFRAILRP